ncbi:MAG: RNA 2',3'-cyclic phosphodiesterase [Schwartzia sp.]|nr:RNA 2',3'-cyclic phosphodiesterase [Schwartzia sp. (in: firmicutes)]
MRLFIAILLDEPVLDALTDFQSALWESGLRGRLAPRENLHLTLAFIGEYGNPEAVAEAMTAIPFVPFPLRLEGVGQFGDLYWAGLSESPALSACARRLRRSLAERGIPYDRKRFSPHITLVRKAVFHGGTALPDVAPPSGEMLVRGISLMRSERGKRGMIYTELARAGE